MMAPPDDRIVPPLDSECFADAKAIANGVERLRVHRRLLVECLRRLRAGRQLERDHGVIHPEMTAIVRDVVRLTDLVFPSSKRDEPKEEAPTTTEAIAIAFASRGRVELAELVDRYGLSRVAKRLDTKASVVEAWASGRLSPGHAQRSRIEAAFSIDAGAW